MAHSANIPSDPTQATPGHASRAPGLSHQTHQQLDQLRVDPRHPIHIPDPQQKPRTYFIDPDALNDFAKAHRIRVTDQQNIEQTVQALLERASQQLPKLRANVHDAAAALVDWLQQQLKHQPQDPQAPSLHDTLRQILRPSPDPKDLDLVALAHSVQTLTGQSFSPKRIKTALHHLRHAMRPTPTESHVAPRTRNDEPPHPHALALDLLAELRRAAGRLIDHDYTDHLTPAHPDASQHLESDCLDYLRHALAQSDAKPAPHQGSETGLAFHLLAQQLAQRAHPAEPPTPHDDQRLVLDAAAALEQLAPASLPALLAHLNVLVVHRAVLPHALYLAETLRVAHEAAALHQDPHTRALLTWTRRPQNRNPHTQAKRQIPGPTRVASYATANAATRLLTRLFDRQLDPHEPAPVPPEIDALQDQTHLQLADALTQQLQRTDSGFTLTPTTQLLQLTVHATLTQNKQPALDHYQKLGPDKTTQRLQQLTQHDNHPAILAATAALAQQALPRLNLASVTA